MRITAPWRSVALATALLAASTVPAVAHEGNPHYRSEVTSVTPHVADVQVRVLDHDDALELTNHSDRDVLVYGYEHEQFLRVRADGSVQVNPASATWKEVEAEEAAEHGGGHDHAAAGWVLVADKGPIAHIAGDGIAWQTLDKTGRYAWHDNRIKYRAKPVPPQVTDQSKQTKVFDWSVPIRVGATPGTIAGTLLWVGDGSAGGGFSGGAVVSLVVLALLAIGAVVLVRRRRRQA